MTTRDLVQEIETLSQSQLESVYSFINFLKNPEHLHESFEQKTSVEPFTNEREALDFANYCARKIVNEAW